MSNDFYNASGNPSARSNLSSQNMRVEFASVAAGFGKLPALTGNGSRVAKIKNDATAMEASSVLFDDGSSVTVGASATRSIGGVTQRFYVESTDAAGRQGAGNVHNSTTAGGEGASLALGRSRGAALSAVTAVAANDGLGQLKVFGADGTSLTKAAAIEVYADGAVSTGVVPGRISFKAADASGVLTETARATGTEFRFSKAKALDGTSAIQFYVEPTLTTGDPLYKSFKDDLASTSTGKGASLVGLRGAGTVQSWRDSQKTINLLDPKYGVVGDRSTNDTTAIQAALNDIPDGGALYIPKTGASGGVGPNYKVDTNTLILSANDVTIYSDHKSEYADGFYTTGTGWIIKVTGYGCRFQGVTFQGTGSEDVFSTTDAIVFDRRSLGDVEGNSNLDGEVRDCGFIFMRDAITGYGRNVFIFDNIFSNCKRSIVGVLHTYNAGANTSDFRGWRICGNRFHGCGAPYIRATSTETLPATRDLLDSWCIEMPTTSAATSHLEISDNNVDFSGSGFYKGYLAGAKIEENTTRGSVATFVFAPITDAANQGASSNYVGSVSNNTLSARTADAVTDRGYLFDTNSIYAFGVSNLTIADNKMHNCLMEHIKVTACARAHVIDNRCSNGNMLWATDATTRPGIIVDQSANSVVMGNRVHSQIGTVYSNGIQCTSTTNVSIGRNVVMNATTPVSATATDLAKADSDGLAWQTPTMTNSFTLTTATSKGYRRLFNGRVQISVTVAAGTDNTAAFTLPTGYRPSVPVLVPSVGVFNHAYAQVETNGQVIVNWETTAATSYAINCEFEVA